MPSFQLTGPDGGTYKVDAPDQDAALQAFQQLHASAPPPDAAATYAAMPWYQKPFQAADDTVRLTMDGFTGGYADKASAGLSSLFGSGDYESNLAKERKATADASTRAGWAGIADQGAGMLAGPGKVADAIVGASKAAPILGRALATAPGAVAGSSALVGGFDALGHDQDVGTGALLGAGSGVVGHAAGAALGKGIDEVAGLFNKVPPHLDAAAIRARASNLYNDPALDQVIVNPDAVERLKQAVQGTFANQAYDPLTHPASGAILKKLDDMEGQNVTLKGMEVLRKVAGNAAGSGGADSSLGNATKGAFDNWANKLGPQDVLGGAQPIPPGSILPQGATVASSGVDPQQALGTLQQARALWQRQSKLDSVETALEKANDRAANTYSGGNINNAMRQNVSGQKWARDDWTPDEQAAIQTVISGTPTSNVLRAVGKFSPEHGGLAAMLETGGSLGGHLVAGPAGMVAPLAVGGAGFVAKRLADAMTKQKIDQLQSIIANGGNAQSVFGKPNAVQQLARDSAGKLRNALKAAAIVGSGRLQPTQ